MNDKQRGELANKEYNNFKLNDQVDVDKGTKSIGRVSQVYDKGVTGFDEIKE